MRRGRVVSEPLNTLQPQNMSNQNKQLRGCSLPERPEPPRIASLRLHGLDNDAVATTSFKRQRVLRDAKMNTKSGAIHMDAKRLQSLSTTPSLDSTRYNKNKPLLAHAEAEASTPQSRP